MAPADFMMHLSGNYCRSINRIADASMLNCGRMPIVFPAGIFSPLNEAGYRARIHADAPHLKAPPGRRPPGNDASLIGSQNPAWGRSHVPPAVLASLSAAASIQARALIAVGNPKPLRACLPKSHSISVWHCGRTPYRGTAPESSERRPP